MTETHQAHRRPALAGRSQAKAPRWLGNLTYFVGLLDVVTGLAHTLRERLHALTEVLPGALSDAATAATVVSGVLLLLLAHSLKRRKKRAWRAAIVLLVISLVLHAVKAEPLVAVFSFVGVALLVAFRQQFYALGDPSTRWRAVWVPLVMLTFSVAAGTTLIALNSDDLVGGWPGLLPVLSHVLQGLVGVTGPVRYVEQRPADIMGALLLGLGLMTLLSTVYLVLRAPEPLPQLSNEDDERLRGLLRCNPDSLGYFNLRTDKSVVWSQTGKAAIAYRVVSGVMLASGDPVGDSEAWPGAIRAFLDVALRHAWTPAVLGCSEKGGTIWCRETGFSVINLGDEAVIDTDAFSLAGRPMRNVRQMVKRIERAGYTADVVRVRDTTAEQRRQAIDDAAAWRGTSTERGFSMALGRVLDPDDPDAVLVTARHDGAVRALLQFVPWGEDGMSLDVMRRDRSADPGVNELLIVEALAAAKGLGVRRVSLNFAAFRDALERGERLGAGPLVRAWRQVLLFASRWFQIESLYRFNAKFQPVWVPRFLVYPSTGDLPRVGLAAMEAEAFLTWPKLRWFGAGQ